MVFKYFFWLISGGIILSFYLWQQTQAVRLGYRVEDMKRECERWSQENAVLQLKIEKLSSLERLDQFSKDHNLVAPSENSIIYLEN